MTEAQFDDVIRINLKAVFNCVQIAAQQMSTLKYGRIINIASVSAFGNIGQTNYSASKAGVIGLTKTAALELSRHGITVNAIAPGFFDTRLTQAIPENVKAALLGKVPLKRMGDPKEIAGLVAYLASEEAGYITGQTITIDGGLTVGLSV
jgi:3-oxoacyl-[acyl-carrier protein] reductase